MNDLHVSKNNIPEFEANWREAMDICKEHGISTIIIGGDLWQSSAAQTLDTLMSVRNMLIEAEGFEVIIAEGNHCKVDRNSPLGYSHVFDQYPNVSVVDTYGCCHVGNNVGLIIMGYFPENSNSFNRVFDMVEKALDDAKIALPMKMYSILYAHEGINGGLATPSESELPTSVFKRFDKVLVGHYHDRKVIEGTNIEYIGASRQHNFGEDEEKGYTILYEDGSHKFVKNQVNTRYITIEVGPEETGKELEEKIKSYRERNYKVRVRVNCATHQSETVDRQALMQAGASKVEVRTETTAAQETATHALDKKFDSREIRQEYGNFCNSKGINQEMGLTYLN